MIFLFLSCTEYAVEVPEPPALPAEPDGVCPVHLRVDELGITFVFQWNDDDATLATARATGPGSFAAYDTLVVRSTFSSTATADFEDHWICNDGNAWRVARLPILDPEACACGVATCADMGWKWEPPILTWWGEGVERGLSWADTHEEVSLFRTNIGCESGEGELRQAGSVSLDISSTAGSSEVLDLPYGRIDAVPVEFIAGHAVREIEWASADLGWFVKFEDVYDASFGALVSAD